MSSKKKDFYEILEISKTATDEEIRRAYKKLALKWHPDKNQQNREEAELKFKEIAEAYAILSDRQKRARYDNYGSSDFDMGPMHDTFSFSDASKIFEHFFGGRDPFAGFDDNEFFGRKKGFGRFDDDFFGSAFGHDPFGHGGFGKEFGDDMGFGSSGFTSNFSSSSFGGSGIGHSVSTKTSTVIKNGQKTVRTEKTTTGPDGKKHVEIIEEVKDRNGHVTRTVKSLEDGKEVTGQPKQIGSRHEASEKVKYEKIPGKIRVDKQKMGPRIRFTKQAKP
eukprot:TRINITY_DN4524_c0_g2_i1.p1 TRINITY_DN4524_c0_g2~~TRINITY_DN4524_c0_g2_i1.p1  ORF type:complete len:277 (+),score=67.91 TRINITY_DN4524_c0_g2_i1:137-967(+)